MIFAENEESDSSKVSLILLFLTELLQIEVSTINGSIFILYKLLFPIDFKNATENREHTFQ